MRKSFASAWVISRNVASQGLSFRLPSQADLAPFAATSGLTLEEPKSSFAPRGNWIGKYRQTASTHRTARVSHALDGRLWRYPPARYLSITSLPKSFDCLLILVHLQLHRLLRGGGRRSHVLDRLGRDGVAFPGGIMLRHDKAGNASADHVAGPYRHDSSPHDAGRDYRWLISG